MNLEHHDQINNTCFDCECIDQVSVCCQKSSICYLSFPDSYSGKASVDDAEWCCVSLQSRSQLTCSFFPRVPRGHSVQLQVTAVGRSQSSGPQRGYLQQRCPHHPAG